MRVIAGRARGRPLKGPASSDTRPTSDKVKGAIFSVLETFLVVGLDKTVNESDREREASVDGGPWSGLAVLDLYAGTGALGIEALSRGAERATFIEISQASLRVIRENLSRTGLTEEARVVSAKSEVALARPRDHGISWEHEVALVDAPYQDDRLVETLRLLGEGATLVEGALVAVEHSKRSEPSDRIGDLCLIQRKRYGDTEVSFYQLRRQ